MASHANAFRKWQQKLKAIRGKYPFGPFETFHNQEGRLHRLDGPAFISPQRVIWFEEGRKHGVDVDVFGSKCYYYEGVSVPPEFIEAPQSLTFQRILQEPNAEVRRVGMKIYGFIRLIKEKKAKLIDECLDRNKQPIKLFYIRMNEKNDENSRLAIIHVKDGTPSSKGEREDYYISVPPNMRKAKEAVAWTWRKSAEEYNPVIET